MKPILIYVTALLIAAGAASAQSNKSGNVKDLYGINLIRNAGAEEDEIDNNIPQWESVTVVDNGTGFMQDNYGHTGGEWEFDCDEKCGLPPNAGTYYFRLPIDNTGPHLGLKQTIQLDAIQDTLQKRKITFSFGGYVTGFQCTDPNCGRGMISIVFVDQAGKELAKWNTAKDSHDFISANPEDGRMMKFEIITINNEVPQSAANALISMEADTKDCCNSAYVFFDNLSLTLQKAEFRTPK